MVNADMIAIQIPKPRDEQEFERLNLVLWRCILKDETTHLYGRRGQRQHGVDILGCRNANSSHLVGIQCKLKTEGKRLHEREVREEVDKALTFEPPLSEYIIVTTAPDDVNIQSLVKTLAIHVNKNRDKHLSIAVFGWENLQLEIQRYPEAQKAFDPSYTTQGEQIQQTTEGISEKVSSLLSSKIAMVPQDLTPLKSHEVAIQHSTVQTEHEKTIDDYVALIPDEPETVLALLQKLEGRLPSDASNHLRYRLKTNIAACQLELGQEKLAAAGLISAWCFSPEDPKAISNRALGFVLLEEWDRVRDLAEEELRKDPSNARLAGCYLRSLIHDKAINEPLSFVPKETRDSPEVIEAQIQWLMECGDAGSWWDAAISASDQFPDIPEFQELGASALLSRAIGGERYVYGQPVDDSGYCDVKTAVQIYESLWSAIRDGRRKQRGDLTSIPINLMIAYRMLGNDSGAIALGKEANDRFPHDGKIREYLASFLVEQGDTEHAEKLISGIERSFQTISIRFKIAVANRDWSTVHEIVKEDLAQFPESEQLTARAMDIVAQIELTTSPDVRKILQQARGAFAGKTRPLILLARAARTHGVEDLSQSLFESATLAFRHGDDAYVERVAIAEEATARGMVGTIVEALHSHVPLDSDSAELRTLAQALAFDVPVRDRAVDFFSNLVPEIRYDPFFQRLEGIVHFNRGSPNDALRPLTASLEKDPQLDTLLCLVRAYFAIGDTHSIRELVSRPDVEQLPGRPGDRINISHVLLDFSDPERALSAGYEALVSDPMDAEVTSKFFGLVLRATSANLVTSSDLIVRTGVWVRLTRVGGGAYEALVGESQDRPWGQAVPGSNSFITACLGLRVNDEFQVTNTLGVGEEWTVAEVRPRWLQAFRHLTESFGQRFPDAHGFASLTIADDDIEPVLEQVRLHSAMARQQADVYLQHNIPLVVAAGDRPGGALAFGQYLASIGEDIKVCSGASDERAEALRVIQERGGCGAVVDAFTAWHAAVLGALPVLEERLGRLAIPMSEMQRLREMTDHPSGSIEGDSMSLDYRNGQYFRSVETSEERAERLRVVSSLVETIEDRCSVEPVQVPDNLSELGEKLVGAPLTEAFAIGVMAGKSRILVCEDLIVRQWSREGFGAKGVWIQAALFSAEQAGSMSTEAYAKAVVYLAVQRHGYVFVSVPVLLSVFERDNSRDLLQLEAVCNYVGGENAELNSNTRIVADFVNAIWANAQPIVWASDYPVDSKTLNATKLMFRTLVLERRNGEWDRWAAWLYRSLSPKPRRFLLRWCEENFLSVGKLLALLGRDKE